jgi:hypothetical protein
VYTTLVEQAGVDNAFRIGSGAQSWAQRASGRQPQAEARDSAAEFGGSAAQWSGWRCSKLREQRCTKVRGSA